ncbi:SDR family NAD(P)-dependent oxidoreductase [Cohnella faecalis]|uniref:SDR family NAD(P)-dependent oxidoreductase n=1 Tax=Cohnella faecalis TaxID=2315694 RepID=A0A398CEH9_9BACL|nr:SDR family NAD(P)-dependent oxidoreductase [Cohnella faecalis]RIE01113.1 SDR family NAD(P)-dependent oxidoreductase [Cohnella faecalis]
MSKPIIAVVGAGPGVSAAVARKFGSNGFRVALVARNAISLDALATELREQEIETYFVTADASRPESLSDAFRSIREQLGEPDVLLYNAAAISKAAATALDERQLIEDFKVNVVGALTSVKEVVPRFVGRKEGAVLITGGGFALHPHPDYASLSIGKAGVRSLTYSLAQELKPSNVYVGTVTISGFVSPGTYFDPDRMADKYWELYTERNLIEYEYTES